MTASENFMTSNTQFETPFGAFTLERYPKPVISEGKEQPLRAWDAADEYVLQWVFDEHAKHNQTPNTLILNDAFGALTAALHAWPCWSQTDSYLARQGCIQNLEVQNVEMLPLKNDCVRHDGRLLTSLQWPEQRMDLVIIKIPKTLALLEDQLYHLRHVIDESTTIVAAGMTKNIHNSTMALFENIIGPTTSSLAKKKARLIFSQATQDKPEGKKKHSPYPSQFSTEEFPFPIHNHANVFSRSSLDIGTRFLLQHFPTAAAASAQTIIDLGCGNGVLGIKAQHANPQATIHFVDESYMAIDSARMNFQAAQECGYLPVNKDSLSVQEDRQPVFQVSNSLLNVEAGSADLILNNPPFHQQTVVGDHIAWQMFTDARRVLRRGGEFWVIGNRHLDYHIKLKRLFGHCETVASNRKFVVLRSVQR